MLRRWNLLGILNNLHFLMGLIRTGHPFFYEKPSALDEVICVNNQPQIDYSRTKDSAPARLIIMFKILLNSAILEIELFQLYQ